MGIRSLGLIAFSLVSIGVQSQNIRLSNNAEVSLITGGPGKELYTKFGHSAIRIKDDINKVDQVFNYGTFDFDAPNFYLNFSKGRLWYKLTNYPFNKQKDLYMKDGQSIFEQKLNLAPAEKQRLFDLLLENAKDKNAAYLYDPFFNNCATKPRDIIMETLGDRLQFNYHFIKNKRTIRQLYMDKLPDNSWGSFGITVVLGSVVDRIATPYEHMYIPEYLGKAVSEATVFKGNERKPLVKESKLLLDASPEKPFLASLLLSPLVILSLLSLWGIRITYTDKKNKKRTKNLDLLIFLLTGLTGLLLLMLWLCTDHLATANNFNVLWAFCPNLFFLFYLRRKAGKWHKRYTGILFLMLIVLLVLWVSEVQVFSIVLIPVFVLLLIRYGYLYYYFPKMEERSL